jgi:uncharacterized protein (TIGR02145 family)
MKQLLLFTLTGLLVLSAMASCEKKEEPIKAIAVTGVSLNETTLSLAEGDSETLTATVSPANATNKTVTWSSNNSAVATVDVSGKVTALKAGSAVITVTTSDGDRTATCTVTITGEPDEPDQPGEPGEPGEPDDPDQPGEPGEPGEPDEPEIPNDPQGVTINGITWATTNVDAPGKFAAKPESFGMFYQWGKKVGWSVTDPIVSSNGDTTWDESAASGNVWELANDPCPDGWQVPSVEDFWNLTDRNYVDRTLTTQTQGGVSGILFIDKATKNSIFLPAAGFRYYSLYGQNAGGYYWSSTAINGSNGYNLRFGITSIDPSSYGSFDNGSSVRCVRK